MMIIFEFNTIISTYSLFFPLVQILRTADRYQKGREIDKLMKTQSSFTNHSNKLSEFKRFNLHSKRIILPFFRPCSFHFVKQSSVRSGKPHSGRLYPVLSSFFFFFLKMTAPFLLNVLLANKIFFLTKYYNRINKKLTFVSKMNKMLQTKEANQSRII